MSHLGARRLAAAAQLVFDDLTAKGELNAHELAISSIEAAYGGNVQGNATLNWRSGWRAQGA